MTLKYKQFPRDCSFSASAPCRIDSGGTWDIKAMALPFESISPTTVNIALNLRTTVVLSPFDPGWIKIGSRGFKKKEIVSIKNLSLKGPFTSYLAAFQHFGIHGVEVQIESAAPVKSALGGSSTALVAVLKAISKVLKHFGLGPLSRGQILSFAYHMEDAMSGGNCGLQDQAAATFGGVNQWIWRHSTPGRPFVRTSLLDKSGMRALSERLLVAFSGKTHSSVIINRKWVKDFLSNKTTSGWIKVNNIVHQFAKALSEHNWAKCALLLRDEMSIRRQITPEALLPVTLSLIQIAEKNGCGARFSGAGAGGAVWAIGEIANIKKLENAWAGTLKQIPKARLLTCKVDHQGVK